MAAMEELSKREQEAKYLAKYYRQLFALKAKDPAPTWSSIKNALIAQDKKMGRKK